MSRYFLKTMADAYLDAAAFTDSEESDDDTVFSTQFKSDAYKSCADFENACATLEIDLRDYPAAQVGHDLWLTRNGHGAGFWDRPEVYGQHANLFTGMARAQGYHDSEFV